MQCAIELSRRHQRVLAGPRRTSPNTPSRACIVAWRGPGHFHRHWMARSLRSAPGQLGVVRETRTRIGPRQKGGGAIWALAVSLSSVVKRICGLAVLLTAERVKFRFVPGSVIGGLCESFRLWDTTRGCALPGNTCKDVAAGMRTLESAGSTSRIGSCRSPARVVRVSIDRCRRTP